jgi:hypothetical protein
VFHFGIMPPGVVAGCSQLIYGRALAKAAEKTGRLAERLNATVLKTVER